MLICAENWDTASTKKKTNYLIFILTTKSTFERANDAESFGQIFIKHEYVSYCKTRLKYLR